MYLYEKKERWYLGGFEYLHADTTVEADPGSGGASFAVDAAPGGELHPYTKIEFGGSGTQTPVSATNPLPVGGSGASALGKAEDAAHSSGDVGVMALAVRKDTAAASSGTTGDYEPLSTDANGLLRVNASGVAVPVTDNGGALTVDGAVSVSSVTPGTGATDLGKAEDAAHTTGDVGVMSLAVRRDANTSLVGTDGDYAPLQVNADGSLKVAITAGAGSGGTSIQDDAAFTPASTSLTPVGGTYRSTLDAVDDGDAGAFAMTAQRALHVNLRDSSGNELGAGDQYAEDAAHNSGDMGTMALAVRRDANTSLVGTDGDYAPLQVNATGALKTDGSAHAQPVTDNGGTLSVDDGGGTLTVDGSVGITGTVAVTDNGGTLSVDDGGGILTVDGSVTAGGAAAHDAAVSGNPVRVAGRAGTGDFAAVADGDTTDLLATILGKLVVQPYALPGNTWSYAAAAGGLVNTTGVTAKAAAGAGIRNYITSIQVINSHATQGTEVVVRDGASGTVLHRGYAAPAGGGYACKFDPPLRGTANTLVEIAEITATGTNGVLVSLQGHVGAE